MSPRGRSDDIGWQHGRMLEGKRHWFQCNYCNMEFHRGGVSCLKKYLAGGKGAGYSEVFGCPSVSYDVKIAIAQHLRQIRAEKMTHSQNTLQDDEGGSEDEHHVPSQATNVHVTVRDPYEKDMQRALRESRAEAWARGDSELRCRDDTVSSSHPSKLPGLHRYYTDPPRHSTSSIPQRKRNVGLDVQEIEPYAFQREHGKAEGRDGNWVELLPNFGIIQD
ncbi:hypothetical protein Taro_038047, partial [Colocasia esculenta]|nr:hypothetical protein [Colocasia esculenta]